MDIRRLPADAQAVGADASPDLATPANPAGRSTPAMIRTRTAVGLTAVMLAASALGVGVSAQAPTPTPTPTTDCAAPTTASGMMTGPSAMPGSMGAMMGGSPMPRAAVSAAPAVSPAPIATVAPGAVRIEMTLLDTMRITPCSIAVKAGVPITFVVTNKGSIDHEFFLGDAAEQAAHDQEMITMGSAAMHEGEPGMTVKVGATEELTYTFATPGQYEAACHVPGHYPAGMKASITVVP